MRANPPAVFTLDRPQHFASALLWQAATSATEVRFDLVSKSTKVSHNAETDVFSCTDGVPKTVDLLRGIHFSVPVKNFRLWTGVNVDDMPKQSLIDLKDHNIGIKGIFFYPPIPIVRLPYEKVWFSYSFVTEEEIHAQFDSTCVFGSDYGFLNPLFQVSTLVNSERMKLMKLQEEKTTVFRTQTKLENPDGSIVDFDTIEINVYV